METLIPSDDDQARRLEGLYESFGPLVNEALQAPDVVEISLNDDGVLWVEKRGEAMQPVGNITQGEARIISETALALTGYSRC